MVAGPSVGIAARSSVKLVPPTRLRAGRLVPGMEPTGAAPDPWTPTEALRTVRPQSLSAYKFGLAEVPGDYLRTGAGLISTRAP